MKQFIKNILLKSKSQEIKKSILIACMISVIVPLFLPLISNIIFGVNPPKYTLGWDLDHYSVTPIFLEVSIAEISLLWIIIRFIPFIIFGYVNGLIFKKMFSKKSMLGNVYLFISSMLFYFMIIMPIFELFLFLNSIKPIQFIFDVTDAFNF